MPTQDSSPSDKAQWFDQTRWTLIQGFFCHAFERDLWASAHPAKGKFRSFLLASLNYFLANEKQFARAQKRGGGQSILSLDDQEPEQRYLREPVCQDSPDVQFERRWACTVLEQAKARLQSDYGRSGKGLVFDRLQPFLSEEAGAAQYRQVAVALGMTPGAVSVAIHRLRQRLGESIRQEIARTVAEEAEVEEEYRHLRRVLAGERPAWA